MKRGIGAGLSIGITTGIILLILAMLVIGVAGPLLLLIPLSSTMGALIVSIWFAAAEKERKARLREVEAELARQVDSRFDASIDIARTAASMGEDGRDLADLAERLRKKGDELVSLLDKARRLRG